MQVIRCKHPYSQIWRWSHHDLTGVVRKEGKTLDEVKLFQQDEDLNHGFRKTDSPDQGLYLNPGKPLWRDLDMAVDWSLLHREMGEISNRNVLLWAGRLKAVQGGLTEYQVKCMSETCFFILFWSGSENFSFTHLQLFVAPCLDFHFSKWMLTNPAYFYNVMYWSPCYPYLSQFHHFQLF